MPPKKRALAEADPNAQAASRKGNKKGKTSAKDNTAQKKKDENPLHDLDKKDPYEYIVMARPLLDFEIADRYERAAKTNQGDENPSEKSDQDDDEEEEDDEEDDDPAFQKYKQAFKQTPMGESSTAHPDHRWIMMRGAYMRYCDMKYSASWTIPDRLGMYIYNDWHSYGLLEIIDNQLLAFHQQWIKKNKDEAVLKQMWTILVALVWWLSEEQTDMWMHADDGERINRTAETIGIAFLTCLNELDQATMLKPDSEIVDLELVVSLYGWTFYDKPAYCIDDVEWLKYLAGYVKTAKLDLEKKGNSNITEIWQLVQRFGVQSKKGKSPDLFGWKKQWAKHKKWAPISTVPGDHYDISKMSRQQRASYAFDKKDPLADVPLKDLREGRIMLC